MNYNFSNLLDLRSFQEQVKKNSDAKKCSDLSLLEYLDCSSDLKKIANPRPSASNLKSFSRSLDQFLLTVGQNNLPLLTAYISEIEPRTAEF